MQLPTVVRPTINTMPPMYTWPRSIKRVILAVAVLLVITAYMLLAGGIIAILAVLAGQISG